MNKDQQQNEQNPTTVTFTRDKETKHTVRFTLQDGPVTGSLYVKKDDERAEQETIEVSV